MFETKTFENILSDMLSYVSDRNPSLDTREGSIIYTALAPIALELETAYHEMDMIIDETFIESASKEYLIKHGDQVGLPLIEATFGHFTGEFNGEVAIGTRFNLDKFNYSVIKKLAGSTNTNHLYELVCETAGSEPNSYLGDLTPITYIKGISSAKLIECTIPGEDEEDTEQYRYRLQTYVKTPPIDGNVAQYDAWLSQYKGVGKYKIFPCSPTVNCVKLLITNSENGRAGETLLDEVQNYFDPGETGMGDGVAPIGSIVTVETVTEVPVKIECTIKHKNNSTEGVKEAIDKYLKSMALIDTRVAYMPLYAQIYNAEGVEDIISLKITVKGGVMDANADDFIQYVVLDGDEIPVLAADSVWSVQ